MHFIFSRTLPQPVNRRDIVVRRLVDQVLQHGQFALNQLRQVRDPENGRLLADLMRQGYLQQSLDGSFHPTALLLRQCERTALRNLLHSDHHWSPIGQHSNPGPAGNAEDAVGLRPFVDGDRLDQVDWLQSFRNAIGRKSSHGRLLEDDLIVRDQEIETNCATVILVDLSGSMARYGKFTQTRLVALALHELVRRRFPEDHLQIIGFATFAWLLSGLQLLEESPRSVQLTQEEGVNRFSSAQSQTLIPQHFTNIQAGLVAARGWLARQGTDKRRILCITDGEPTAHFEKDELVLAFPSEEATAQHTIREVARCVRAQIQVRFFGLIEDSQVTGLRSILDRLAHVAREPAIYCTGSQLGPALFNRFVNGRGPDRRGTE